jgi:glycerol-3-phosphate acyltransferase PlsY
MQLQALILAIAYLLGSIPFGYLLVRFVRKEDIRSSGSGNIGATNVARSGSKGLGIATLALDTLKALTAVLIAKHFFPSTPAGLPSTIAVAAGVIAVIGHIFPLWLGFKGGKGVASALGVFLALAPFVALAALAVFIVIAFTTRLVSLASIIAAITVPLFALFLPPGRSPVLIAGFAIISLGCILKHHANIARLLNGTEGKFGKSRQPSPDPTEKVQA